MKRTAISCPEAREIPSAWLEAEYAALQTDAADTGDDRVSQNMFDLEDEREEVDSIVHGFSFAAD